jgi:polysaccharide chain length determinant protein (PEP-CTERM system associated)
VVPAITFVVAHYLPNRYRSETLILVVPQRVPETYVRSTVTTRIEDRLQSISQQILSRTRLERIIQDFNLYAGERRTWIMEDVVEQMRKDIEVQIVKGDAFRVAYTGEEPRTVMRVTERLASLFIDESLRDREVLAEGTNVFLEAQLEDARKQLVEHEKKLEQYRRRFDGQLPSQVESNMQTIHSTELQLQAVTESLNRDRDRKMLLERQIGDLSLPDAAAAAMPAAADPGVDGDVGARSMPSAAQRLDVAKRTLDALSLRLKPEHPDIIRLKRTIRELEQKVDAEALMQPLSGPPVLTPIDRAKQARVNELRAEREALDRDIENKLAEEKRLRGIIGQYQARVAAAPTRESELVELTRDYDTLQKTYAALLAKREDSKIAANLERRQIGEQFKVLDPARMPEKPFSPNRILINSLGGIGGLALGIAFVALIEYRDRSLKTDADVSLVLALPVLAAVPMMITSAERRRRSVWTILVSATTVVVVLGATALLAWKLWS